MEELFNKFKKFYWQNHALLPLLNNKLVFFFFYSASTDKLGSQNGSFGYKKRVQKRRNIFSNVMKKEYIWYKFNKTNKF